MKTMNCIMTRTRMGVFVSMFCVFTFLSCSGDEDEEDLGNWIDRSVLDGTPRSSSAAFSIGNKGYMGTGYDGDDY